MAVILFAKELAKRLRGTGITTYAVHPGTVDTPITRNANSSVKIVPFKEVLFNLLVTKLIKTAWHGAQTSLYCCLEESIASHTGRYYADCSETEPSSHACNEEHARRLWDIAEKVTGFNDIAS